MRFDWKDTKSLLCDSRIRILKSLKDRMETIAELSREPNLSKSTVHGHLTKLMEAIFVERMSNPERKWVYYRLTEKGHELLRSEFWCRIMLVLAVAVILGDAWKILTFTSAPKYTVRGIIHEIPKDHANQRWILLMIFALKRLILT